MDNVFIFNTVSNTFILGWLSLLIGSFLAYESPNRRRLLFIGGRLIPLVLLAAFLSGVALTRSIEPKGHIFSYDGVITMLSVPERVLNLWTEILAYMLFVARWIVDDLQKRHIPKGFSVFCVIATFLSGALGILAYFISTALHYIGLRYAYGKLNFIRDQI
ncbi:MAG: DUF4281 domain-containing protein [Agarilytica sp.]